MNSVNLSGIICSTPKFEISETKTKDLLANFCIKNIAKNGKTSYIWCTVIGTLAQKVMQLQKGNFVIIEGELICYNQEKHYFYTVEVYSLEIFLNKANEIISQEETKIIERNERQFFNQHRHSINNNINTLDDFYNMEE